MAEPLRFLQPPQGGLDRHSALGDLCDLLPDLAPGVRLDEMPFPGQLLLRGQGGSRGSWRGFADHALVGCIGGALRDFVDEL
jgi:hypothetical protein